MATAGGAARAGRSRNQAEPLALNFKVKFAPASAGDSDSPLSRRGRRRRPGRPGGGRPGGDGSVAAVYAIPKSFQALIWKCKRI